MVELEIDGKTVEVAEGSMVMDAATKLGLYVPHFCYHKKLSIAANCRMCLVEVEKAPKPLPACATPVTAGMKVFTSSPKAKQAQKSVMEFLLINHPLDCPICDQGGECQLQDLAVGYGPSASRYTEEKRVVFHKSMGPLISAEEMSRCIHCTRCVRFGQEIAGVMELGMAGRGEHSEIMSFVGNAIESELSGNMIDICPVGALTSKPFRYSARTWELSRKRSVSPHDSIGSNIVVQSKNNEVKRVVPLENEAVNECWISDRDRFSYESLNAESRLTKPMAKDADGHWQEISWEEALNRAATAMKAAADRGPNRFRTLLSSNSTLEEMALAASLTRALKSDSVDFRPRLGQSGFDHSFLGTPSLGMPLADVSLLERALVVGSFLRQDHPLLAQRLRQAVRHGASLAVLHGAAQDLLMPTAHQWVASPAHWAAMIDQIAAAACDAKGVARPTTHSHLKPSTEAQSIAAMMLEAGEADAQADMQSAIFLGNSVLSHPEASSIWLAAQNLAEILGARLGFTVEGGNGVGGYFAKARPTSDGLDAASMFDRQGETYLLVGVDPAMDCVNPHQARQSLKAAKSVIALTAFKDGVMDVATLVLPIAPFTETSGTYISCEGRVQSTQAVVRPRGEARPGWKVLRVLGNLVGAEDFDQESSEDVRRQVIGDVPSGSCLTGLSAKVQPSLETSAASSVLSITATGTLVRLADVPIYRSDAMTRHAESLQSTSASAVPKAHIHPADLLDLGLAQGSTIRLTQADRAQAVLEVISDSAVARGVVRVPAAHSITAKLGPMIGLVMVEAA